MTVLHDLAGWPAGPLHVALGVFDGVHVGHRAVVADLVRGARPRGARAIVATFDPLPEVGLGEERPVACALTTIEERVELLRTAGADDVAVFTFDPIFAAQSAATYVERLCAAGRVERIVVGRGFRFGKGREGDAGTLRRAGKGAGFDVSVVDPVALDEGIVSSTRIRSSLRRGDVAAAARWLGLPYCAGGVVERGDQRGRELGYPTINVATPVEKLLPRDGIYACLVDVGGATYGAATSLGTRPTFGSGPRRLECHLLDFSGDLYGMVVRVSFVQRLRDELAFAGPEALVSQIARDTDETRAAIGRHRAARGCG